MADETSKQMQARYAHYYNLRSRDKSFNIGDAVLILIPDSTSKTFSQWQGPAKVIAKKAPYTYVVELNGTQRQLHASMIRPYYTRISTLICESASCTVPLERHQTYEFVSDTMDSHSHDRIDSSTMYINSCTVLSHGDEDFAPLRTLTTDNFQRQNKFLPSQ